MKKFLSFMALATIVAFSSCNDDDDVYEVYREEIKPVEETLECTFEGLLADAESEYLSDATNGVDENNPWGSVFSSTFTDATGMFTFHNQCADWYGMAQNYSLSGGFTYTNKTDNEGTMSIAAFPAKGKNGTTYLSAFQNSTTPLEVTICNGTPYPVKQAYFTNATYAYLSMKNGDAYAKQFDATDWFKLTITGWIGNVKTGDVEFYLAQKGNIVKDWQLVNLESLGFVNKLTFELTSSDTGEYGMNTPAYFCMDGLSIVLKTTYEQ